MNSSSSIIYNNYYELIKIDDTLKELTRRNDSVNIVDNLKQIKQNLSQISRLQVLDQSNGRQTNGEESNGGEKQMNTEISTEEKQKLSLMLSQLLHSRKLNDKQMRLIQQLKSALRVDQNESFFLQVNEFS
ncbi:unnamed protein product [Ambrosiozyma monospora]|uniref:Unnamed protein product n=1 Tax=Ambrosiozyma monospora TaxID=43982 RepID=A0ACB5UAY9_AMBMO|nr:unnamed protein product [Ambrosiozyma monospora]